MTPDKQPPTAEQNPSPPADPIIGIDLGTTNSLVALCTEAGPRILTSPAGQRSLPSVVRLAPPNNPDDTPPYTVAALGNDARQHAIEFPTTTLHSVKRLLGRSPQDLGDALAQLPYPVVPGPNHTARIALDFNQKSKIKNQKSIAPPTVTPQQISALILAELKRWAEHALSTPVSRAVITVPAYFDDAQRQATRDAGRLAGLNVLRIVNEPTAAALAYGLDQTTQPSKTQPLKPTLEKGGSIPLSTKLNPTACTSPPDPAQNPSIKNQKSNPSQTVAIYDLGGGTFDVSILRLQQTDQGTVDQVLATDGDTHLGGDDLDQQIINLIQSKSGHPTSVGWPPQTQQALRSLAEQTKIKLSTDHEAPFEIDLSPSAPTPKNLKPRAEAGSAAEAPDRLSNPKSKILNQKFTHTLTRPAFESLIAPFIDRTLDACRRCLKNAKLSPDQIDRVVLVGGSTRIPYVRQQVAKLFNTDPYTALNPDEVVALGASVQAAILAGIRRDTLLLDVIPLSLGIETMGGAVAKLIVANSTIPARASETFSTYAEGQTSVKIHVLQGERELVKDCRSLATFHLTGIPPMPAGLPKLNVTFLVDANGVLSVQATEERSGRRAHTQVIPNHGLTRDEVAQIEADSFTHAKADMQAHRLIDLRLNAKLDIRNIQKQLANLAPGVPASAGMSPPLQLDPTYKQQIESHIQKVQTFIDTPDPNNDADAFQQALHDMDHATLRLAELNIARTLRDSNT